jgi:hypothetical protein
VKRDDPYHILGLSYSDGATTTEIREAFKKRAKQLHPDVNRTLSADEAHVEFQRLVKAYEALTKYNTDDDETVDNWRRTVWRQSDQIALDRTDVAGVARKRPAPPAASMDPNNKAKSVWDNYNMIGHPQGLGGRRRNGRRDEYLGDGSHQVGGERKKRPSSVGRGQSKWVTKHNQSNINRTTTTAGNTSIITDDESSSNDNISTYSASGVINQNTKNNNGYEEWNGTTFATKAKR